MSSRDPEGRGIIGVLGGRARRLRTWWRGHDRAQVLSTLAIVCCLAGEGLWTDAAVNDGKGASQRASAAAAAVRTESNVRSGQRTADLRARCRKDSRATAADVTLNWTYYQSETQLDQTPVGTRRFDAALAALSPAERRFILTILSAGSGQSQYVLKVRARADRNAAYVKAQSVDYRDLHLIPPDTGLGSTKTPRGWVMKAHYSCTMAIR